MRVERRSAPPIGPRAKRAPKRRRGARGWLPIVLLLLVPLAAGLGYLLKPAPPVLVFEPDLLDLGTVRVGDEARATLTVRNSGEAKLVLEPSTLVGVESGVPSADGPTGADAILRVASDGCVGTEVAAGETCAIDVVLRPAAPGTVRGRLRLAGEKLLAERTVPLLGRAVAPSLALEPAVLAFDDTVVGKRGGRQAVRLVNRGDSPLTIGDIALEGPAASDYPRVRDGCTGTPLAPGATCTVSFDFVPTLEGERDATVRVRSDSFTGATAMPRLVGRALPQLPAFAISADRFDFGALRVGDEAAPRELTIMNDGDAPLVLERLSIVPVVEGVDDAVVAASSFAIETDCVTTVAPGGRCVASVGFAPSAAAALGAMLEIEHGDGVQRVPLVGRGTAPRLVVEPDALSFGEATVGRATGWKDLRVRNAGDAAMRFAAVGVDRVAIRGSDAAAFSLDPARSCPDELLPDAECTVRARFTARRQGPQQAELVVRHDDVPYLETPADRAPTARVRLSGVGLVGRLAADPARVELGDIEIGRSTERSIRLHNSGRAPLRIASSEVRGSGFSMRRDCAGVDLTPGAECSVVVRFAPTGTGPVQGRLVVQTDAAPLEVPLAGLGLAPPTPRLELSPDKVAFGEVEVWQRSGRQIVQVRNTGTGVLFLRSITVGGPAATDFQRVGGTCGDRLEPRASCTLSVFFAPSSPGRRDGVLTLETNADPSTRRLLLTGTGIAVPESPSR